MNDVTVRFEMAVTYYAASPTGEFPIWLEIESIESTLETFQGHLADTANKTYEKVSNLLQSRASTFVVEAPLVTSPKSMKRTLLEQSQGPKRKAVRFETTLTMELEALRLENTAVLDNAVPDLCLVDDVCDHFQKQQKRSQHHACMGYLKDSCIQRFYQLRAEKCVTGKSKSLAEVISWISEDPVVRNLPRSVMIQLAGSLAAAVLQYHSTPWLSETWKSQDIVFFGIDDFRQGMISLTSPHLNVEFSRQKGKGKVQIEGKASLGSSSRKPNQDSAITIYNARNELLFRLGIILLEVGFARPWPMLRESVIKTLPENKSTDYHVAEKLACLLVNTMGPKYPRIIRKCLGCDFGLGESDLESEGLQGSFLLDVVVALKALGQQLPKF